MDIADTIKTLNLQPGEFGQFKCPLNQIAESMNLMEKGKYALIWILTPPMDMPVIIIKRLEEKPEAKTSKKAGGAE